jgi:GNAT superfamily N-acetyltransferase
MITFQRESFTDTLETLKPLLPLHYEEIANNHDRIPLDPDYDSYLRIDQEGKLHFYTVRCDGDLVGYHIAFVTGHLHYKSTLHAMTDIYFIHKDYRYNGVGFRFMQAMEADLKQLGVVKIITGTKTKANHSKMFEALGYNNTELQFTKLL